MADRHNAENNKILHQTFFFLKKKLYLPVLTSGGYPEASTEDASLSAPAAKPGKHQHTTFSTTITGSTTETLFHRTTGWLPLPSSIFEPE